MHSTVITVCFFDQEEYGYSSEDIFDMLPKGADYVDEISFSKEETEDVAREVFGSAVRFERGVLFPAKDAIEEQFKKWYENIKALAADYSFDDYKKDGYETWCLKNAIEPTFGLKFLVTDYGLLNPNEFYSILLRRIESKEESRFTITQLFDYHF